MLTALSHLSLPPQGSISPAELYTFFREIHVMWVKMGEYADLAIYDVVDEILDMVSEQQ
jgi:serine/threonine-protein phosphatase 2A regulatory subunit B''